MAATAWTAALSVLAAAGFWLNVQAARPAQDGAAS